MANPPEIKSDPETIILQGGGPSREYKANGAITPGELVDIQAPSSGETRLRARRQNTANVRNTVFAIEDSFNGNNRYNDDGSAQNGIDDDYANDNVVFCVVAQRGSIVNARLSIASSASSSNVAVGDYLAAHTDGTLRETSSPANAVAMALESVTANATILADGTRIRVEIL